MPVVLTNQKAGKGGGQLSAVVPVFHRSGSRFGPAGASVWAGRTRSGPAEVRSGLRRAATGDGGPGEGAQERPAAVQLVPRPVQPVRG